MGTAHPAEVPHFEVDNSDSASIYNIEYILVQLEKIQAQNSYPELALSNLSKMDDGDSGETGSPGNIQGQAKAQAFGDIVRARETTNQQLMRFYEKMYDTLTAGTIQQVDEI